MPRLLFIITLVHFILIVHVCSISGQRKRTQNIRSNSTEKCDEQRNDRLDTHLHKLLSNKFPTNNRELRIFCNRGYRSLAYGMTFIKQCLNDFSKKAVSVVLFPIQRELDSVCRTGGTSRKAKELMIAANCGNAAKPGLRKCYRYFVKQELISKRMDKKKRMPVLCCEFYNLRECFKLEAEEVKVCTPRTIDYVDRWATQIYGELIDIMCIEYPADSDKCDKVLQQMPELDLTLVKQPKSFLSPLIEIVGGMEDEN